MGTQPPEPSANLVVDERFVQDWIAFGMAEIEKRLLNEREFLKWCDRNDRNERDKP